VSLDSGGTAYATYLSGGGSTALTFRYVVAAGDLDTNGIALGASVNLNGAAAHDAAGNSANLTLSGVESTADVHVGVAPVVAATGRGLLTDTDGEARISPASPFIWLPPPQETSGPETLVTWTTVPTTSQTVWSPVPLLSAAQHIDSGTTGDGTAIGISALSVTDTSFIDRLVNPDPVALVALTGTGTERSSDLEWRPPHFADEILVIPPDATGALTAPSDGSPQSAAGGGKASLYEQFTRYGQDAWQRERLRLVGSAQRIVRTL
jgi:hypothetical protein